MTYEKRTKIGNTGSPNGQALMTLRLAYHHHIPSLSSLFLPHYELLLTTVNIRLTIYPSDSYHSGLLLLSLKASRLSPASFACRRGAKLLFHFDVQRERNHMSSGCVS